MDTDQDLKDAQYLSQQYPELDYWRKCINDKDLRGFVTDDENDDDDGNGSDVNRDTIASHNLSNLLEILEKSDDAIEKVDESDKEWDEMCQILSQKTNERRAESPEIICSDDDDDDQGIDEILGEKQGKEHENSLKRKPSLDIDKNVTKRSKLDDLDETFNPSQDCSVYSRKNTSSPSILQELDFVEDDKNESGDQISQSDIKSPVKLSVSPIMETDLPKSPNQFDETDHIQSLILQELDFADLDDKNESGDHIKQSDIKSPVKLSVSSIIETALPKSPNQGFSKSISFLLIYLVYYMKGCRNGYLPDQSSRK